MADDPQEPPGRDPRPVLQRQDAFEVYSQSSQTSDYFSIDREDSLQEVPGEDDYIPEDPDLDDTEVPILMPGSKAETNETLNATYSGFTEKRQELGIDRDPRLWSELDVTEWLRWTMFEFGLALTNLERVQIPGRILWARGKGHLVELFPEVVGEMMWEHLEQLVRDCSEPDCLRPEKSQDSGEMENRNRPRGQSSEVPQYVPSPDYTNSITEGDELVTTSETNLPSLREGYYPKKEDKLESHDGTEESEVDWFEFPEWGPCDAQRVPLLGGSEVGGSEGETFKEYLRGREGRRSEGAALLTATALAGYTGSGPIQMWHFLLELLTDASCGRLLDWTGDGWEFKITEPEEVAARWGRRINKANMSSEKLSRGLRYYYDKTILRKSPGKRHTYRFVGDLQRLLGYSPEELRQASGRVRPSDGH